MSDGAVSDRQHTIAKEVSLKGTGLHTGQPCTLRLLPAPANAGIWFLRTDLPHRPAIPATAAHAVESSSVRRTVLAKDGVEVQTVEHFMSALWGVGVDNASVEVSSAELPGVDGSAGPFVELLKSAGATEQAAPRKFFSPREALMVEEGDSSITVFPDRALQVSYTLSYDHPLVKAQFVSFGRHSDSFEAHVAPARTFCLAEEADALRAKGYGKGANYDNTLVIGNGGVIRNTLRFDDEFARHKLLDLLGDLYLLGTHLRARVIAIKSGHPLNVKLLRKLSQAVEQGKAGAIQSGTREALVGPQLDITQIQQILPHRAPFLLVDRIVELTDTRAVGLKSVTMNEYFFPGHFPGRPVMPGVLIVEAMAQVGGIVILNKPENKGRLAYFMAVDQVKFRKPVVPGDQLVIEAELGKMRSRTGQIVAKAYVDGKLACEGELMFALADE